MSNKVLLGALTAMLFGLATTNSVIAQPPERTSIVDIALGINQETGEFSSLIAALTKVDNELGAGLIPLLDGKRQFTVFAPTDAAFDAAAAALEEVLGEGATGADLVEALSPETLLAILTYHVAPGNRDADDVLGSSRVRTVSKGFVFPYVDGDIPYIEDTDSLGIGSVDAQIVIPNVFADNGVIHVIDQVLIP